MKLNEFAVRRFLLSAAGVPALVFCGLCAASHPGLAQQQQLPADAADAQIPLSFPDGADAAQGGQAMPVPMTTPEAQQAAQAAAEEQPIAIDQAGAGEQPDPQQIPAAPEQRRLVPATAMGAAAQNADSGQPAPALDAGAADPGAQAGEAFNPVEAAAAAMDADDAANADLQPTTRDVLEQYTARAEEAASGRESLDGSLGEALPEVSTLNMVRLEGSGFDGAAGQQVTVGIDGQLVDGKTKAEQEAEIREEAFDAAITGMFPLSPEQVQNLLKRYDTTQEAAKKPVYENPRPEISVQNISLDPGVAPPVVKTAVGNVTTLNILDATGAPWPVQDVTWAGDYEIVEPEEGGHIIRITPMSHFARGNIVIRMLTLKTPLTMTLETGRDVVQYRVDARIPEYGPFASAPIMQGGKSLVAGSPDLTSLLDGVMPGGMTRLQVAGVDGRTTAYEMGGTTYVRTPLTLLSPAWQSSVSSADGMNVYALSSAPVLLLSDGGEFMRATIRQKEDLLDE